MTAICALRPAGVDVNRIADRGGGCRNWGDSARGASSGRTGIPATAVVPLRAANGPHLLSVETPIFIRLFFEGVQAKTICGPSATYLNREDVDDQARRYQHPKRPSRTSAQP